MTKNELYDLEKVVYKHIDRIKREQAEYLKGVEYGIDLMFNAVRTYISEEEQRSTEQCEKD